MTETFTEQKLGPHPPPFTLKTFNNKKLTFIGKIPSYIPMCTRESYLFYNKERVSKQKI